MLFTQATCEDLKRQLVNLASLPVERQRLIFRGRVLPNESRLSDAGVTNNCTLHLVEWQLGAGQQPQQQQQQGAAATGAGANWAEMLGGLFGAPPGAAAGAGGPGTICVFLLLLYRAFNRYCAKGECVLKKKTELAFGKLY